jgi:glutathione S-transferase
MEPALYWYSICAVALFLKMLALSSYQGFHRISTLTFTNPEDAGVVGRQPAAEELPQVRRAARAWLNDLENIPIFFALGIVYVLVGASPEAAPWLFLTFTTARILHTLMYLLGLQPWRTIAYAIAVGCLLAMSGTIVATLS